MANVRQNKVAVRSTLKRSHLGNLKVGYVPLIDAAPLIVAQEYGLFDKYGLSVELKRELGWASVRDKVVFGELNVAHAPAGLVIATRLGLNCQVCETVTGLVMNCQGNAITVSKKLHDTGVDNAKFMGSKIRLDKNIRRYTFATVSMVSSHYFLLRNWLKSGGVDPDKDVRIVVLPPSLMVANLKEGNIDGFCVGEPWNSVSANEGHGVIIATLFENRRDLLGRGLVPGRPSRETALPSVKP
ncbi:MAG: CmpA/NrtA family ABC transporter substrate-binding protein, partial [Verrucomicrobiota bacterium]